MKYSSNDHCQLPVLTLMKASFFHTPQRSQASSIVIPTAIISTQSGLRRRLWTSTRELPKDTINFQDAGSHVHTISISKSVDAITTVKIVNSCYKGWQFIDREQRHLHQAKLIFFPKLTPGSRVATRF